MNHRAMTEPEIELLPDLLEDLEIRPSSENEYRLILWNDHVNNMVDIVLALIEICKLAWDESHKIMMEAHTKGKAYVLSGCFDDLNSMKTTFNARGIEVTVE